jgi:hypothetical protein
LDPTGFLVVASNSCNMSCADSANFANSCFFNLQILKNQVMVSRQQQQYSDAQAMNLKACMTRMPHSNSKREVRCRRLVELQCSV